MTDVYSVNRERTNNSKVYIWDCDTAFQAVILPVASSLTDLQVGEVVSVNASGEVVRFNANDPIANAYGITVGFPVDDLAYPAFSGIYKGNAVVATIGDSTEVVAYQINTTNGNYVAPTLNVGANVRFVYNTTTKRWGVVQSTGSDPVHGRVMEVVKNPDNNQSYYHIMITR